MNAIERLAARFPTLDEDHIAQVVQEEYDRMNGARVRNFVPLIVEHEATERLRLEAEARLSATETEDTVETVPPSRLDPIEVQCRSEPPSGPLLGNSGRG